MKWINYRPNNLSNFIGQDELKFNLSIYINNVRKHQDCLDHVLISGPSGCGKTTIATILANELNYTIIYAQGAHLKNFSDILNLFSLVTDNQIIFIDEFHMIDKSIIEILYTIIEDFVIDIPIGVNNNSKITRMKLPHFTIIVATNYLWKLPNPLIDRFPIKLTMLGYTNDDIYQILIQSCNINGFNCRLEHLNYIASISRNNPRIANNNLKRYYDFLSCYPDEEQSEIQNIFNKMGIYHLGLSKNDIIYLKALKNHKALSAQSLSQILLLDKNTIENNIEQYLIKLNFITISSIGRKITQAGLDYLSNLK